MSRAAAATIDSNREGDECHERRRRGSRADSIFTFSNALSEQVCFAILGNVSPFVTSLLKISPLGLNLHLAPGIEKDNLKRCGRQALARSLASRFAPPYSASVQAGSSSANLTHFSAAARPLLARSGSRQELSSRGWIIHGCQTNRQTDREKKPHQIGRAPPSLLSGSFFSRASIFHPSCQRKTTEGGGDDENMPVENQVMLCYGIEREGGNIISVSGSTLNPPFPPSAVPLSFL